METCPRLSWSHVWTEVWLPSVWACITRSPKEKWFEHDLISLNKRRSEAEEIERRWEEQSCLEGGRAKASADVIEIRIWEVNMSNCEGKRGMQVGGKFAVEKKVAIAIWRHGKIKAGSVEDYLALKLLHVLSYMERVLLTLIFLFTITLLLLTLLSLFFYWHFLCFYVCEAI